MMKLFERFIDLMYFLVGGLVVLLLTYIVALEWDERRHEDKKVCIEGRTITNACDFSVGEWKRKMHDCV